MTTPNGTSFVRLRLRPGYAVTYFGRVIGHVHNTPDGWVAEPTFGAVVWARYRTRADAAAGLVEAPPGQDALAHAAGL